MIAIDCEQMKRDDIDRIMHLILESFPIKEISFQLPQWLEILPNDHYLKNELIHFLQLFIQNIHCMSDLKKAVSVTECQYIKQLLINKIAMDTGLVDIDLLIDDKYYYEIISGLVGETVDSEIRFLKIIKDLVDKKNEYLKVSSACEQVAQKGYGIVLPMKDEISLEAPEVIRQGNKFGVKIRANAPSVHMIKTEIETEIAPIVGTEEQANDLIKYMKEKTDDLPSANHRVFLG